MQIARGVVGGVRALQTSRRVPGPGVRCIVQAAFRFTRPTRQIGGRSPFSPPPCASTTAAHEAASSSVAKRMLLLERAIFLWLVEMPIPLRAGVEWSE